MQYSKPFLIFRRRISKTILRILGWKFRGQDPPTSRNQIIFINELEGDIARSQKRWMRHLTADASYFIELGDRLSIEEKINQQATVLIKWRDNMGTDDMVWLLKTAKDKSIKLSACAWDSANKAIKFHSQFNPSPYPERDIRYLDRFFVYFKKI
ncbi:MAG: hypothetical protein CMB32_05980 [Euryarchaeota archaeon]|nr:hypothetical protein [Euryarchaeota archaeon]|tara:strand:+ start:1593 stop:2054 length:462 start_codon:yes stop_codon:yes gene_type:complete